MKGRKFSFLHWFAHVFDCYSKCASIHVEGGYIVSATLCNDCGKSSNILKICKYSELGS